MVKDRPPKKEERRTSVFDFDIPPLWLIQREQSEKDEIYGEVGYGTLLFFTRMVLLHGTSALPEPYWRALDDAINVLGDRSARAHPSQELVERGLVLPAEPCALPDTEIQGRLTQIYTRTAELIRAMHGTPLLYARYTGDREELARMLRRGHLSREAAEYAADIIEGRVPPRQANRPRRQEIDRRNRAITWFVLEAREGGTGDDASIDKAADEFGLGRRAIQKIFSEYRDDETVLLATTRELLKQLQTLHKDMVG